ncbi:MAG: c-type cytochrome [Methylovulum sp.]|jgi:cytochrome c|nr:c-type cytochrome [Methylovulum sp.]MCF7997697.1 c-type cytochrome [Methylovulum sp.]
MKLIFSVTFKTFFITTLMLFSHSTYAVDAESAKAFAKQNNCFRCHGLDRDKDGPAWNKIAQKFKADPEGKDKLLKHLSSGKMVKFPDGHEEAHIKLESNNEKTVNLVNWILSI